MKKLLRCFLLLVLTLVGANAFAFGSEARSGLFFDLGAVKGPFYEGAQFGVDYLFGGEYFYGGVTGDMLFTSIDDDHAAATDAPLLFLDIGIVIGVSIPLGSWLRPYIEGEMGFYMLPYEDDSKESDSIVGVSGAMTAGIDIIFGSFVLSPYYRLRGFYGSGWLDCIGITFGWALW